MSKLVGVQMLRAAAALSVALHHAQHEAGLLAGATGRSFTPVAEFPWAAGIDVFFVISGFIMVYASAGLFGRPGAAKTFLARRVARIVPLYWIVTTLYLALALVSPGVLTAPVTDAGYVLASYLFVPVARPDGAVLPLYSLGWTLNYEMLFYLLFALAIPLARSRAVLALSAGLLVLVAAGQALAPLPAPLAVWTSPIILEFALGMALGLACVEGARLSVLPRALLALAGLAVFLAAGVIDDSGSLRRLVLYGPAAAMLVASVALRRRDPGDSRLARAGSRLGDASYALYLIHPFVIRGLRLLAEKTGLAEGVPPWGFVALSLVCAMAVSVLVFLVVERPLTRWARHALDRGARRAMR